VSPTIFREGPYRFHFFSREEARMHVHVYSSEGEAKFWIEPQIEVAENEGLSRRDLNQIGKIIKDRRDEIASAWREHFGR
jgi:hypothetical protein